MGNISFIIPTQNQDKFNLEYIKQKSEALGYKAELLDIQQLVIDAQDNERICEIWMTDDVYLLKEFDKNDNYSVKLQKANLKCDKDHLAIGVSHGLTLKPYDKMRTVLLTHILKEFHGYWLDEGIHPEFIHHTDEVLNKYL